MKNVHLRALVLAAGFGTRLRPLTWSLPKPLLPVCGAPVVGHTLRQLGRIGCELAVLNLHHLAEAIPKALGESWYGLALAYSREEEILGTLGALHPPRARLREADAVVLINGDTLCPWPLEALVRRHLRTGADATLLVHRRRPDPELGGGVGVDRSGRVVQLRDSPVLEGAGVARHHVFAGAHVLSPKLLERAPARQSDIIDELYLPLLAEGGRIESVTTSRRWHDLGTPERYLEAVLDTARGRWPRRLWRGVHGGPLAVIDAGARIEGSVVENGARVEDGARIEGSIVLPGARVPEGCELGSCIVGPGVELPAGSSVEGRLVTRRFTGEPMRDDETVLGELVYTPLS